MSIQSHNNAGVTPYYCIIRGCPNWIAAAIQNNAPLLHLTAQVAQNWTVGEGRHTLQCRLQTSNSEVSE